MADLALSMVGLAARLFSSIVLSYNFLTTAQGLATDAPILLWKLRIQEIRLTTWGRHWGFEQGRFDQFLEDEGLFDDVVGILREIRSIMDDVEKLRVRYGVQKQSDTVAAEGTASSKLQKRSWASKFRWSLTDKAKFEILVNHLKDFNDGLDGLLRFHEALSLNKAVQSSVLSATDEIQDVRFIQDACENSEPAPPATSNRATIRRARLYSDLRLYARSKELQLQLQELPLPSLGTALPSSSLQSIRKPRSCLTIVPDNSPSNIRILGEYRPESTALPSTVLVEWKDFSPEGPHQVLIAQRVDNLAHLLSKENSKPLDFRILPCLAYVEDSCLTRFGFIVELPDSIMPSPPVSLFHLLGRGMKARVPDLGDRFSLAQALAVSTMHLHDCGWIHGAVRSSNVVFFQHVGKGTLLYNPYIMGFTYSRPSDPSESTLEYSQSSQENDLYRHPRVTSFHNRPRERYRRYHDFYSLGIILLEIGLWEQVCMFWKDHYTPERFMEKLLDGYVPKLGAKMGAVYRDVVRALMTMGSEESEQPLAEDGSQLYWRVIKQLEICRA